MFRSFMMGAVKGLTIFILLSIPFICIRISNRFKAKKQKKNHKKTIEQEADQMIKAWGGKGIDSAGHDDKILFMFVHFMKNKQKEDNSVFKDSLSCAEAIMAASVIFENNTNSKIEDKMIIALSQYLNVHGLSVQTIPDRMSFYHRTIKSNGIKALIEEVCLIIPHDKSKNRLAEYDENSPLMLTGFKDKVDTEIAVNSVMKTLIEFINSEIKKDT